MRSVCSCSYFFFLKNNSFHKLKVKKINVRMLCSYIVCESVHVHVCMCHTYFNVFGHMASLSREKVNEQKH